MLKMLTLNNGLLFVFNHLPHLLQLAYSAQAKT
jgi:hypothetical protein